MMIPGICRLLQEVHLLAGRPGIADLRSGAVSDVFRAEGKEQPDQLLYQPSDLLHCTVSFGVFHFAAAGCRRCDRIKEHKKQRRAASVFLSVNQSSNRSLTFVISAAIGRFCGQWFSQAWHLMHVCGLPFCAA